MQTLVVATGNEGKIKDFQMLFAPHHIQVLPIKRFHQTFDPLETGTTFEENALIKAYAGMRLTKLACLADDSGLEVDALGGAPGVHSARYADGLGDAANNEKLLKALENYDRDDCGAQFRSVIALVYPDETYILGKGLVRGQILRSPQGTGGFGYDPLFYLPTLKRSMAELSLNEKNRISHRKKAFVDLEKSLGIRGKHRENSI